MSLKNHWGQTSIFDFEDFIGMLFTDQGLTLKMLSQVLRAIDDSSAIGEFRRRLWVFQTGAVLRADEIKDIGKYCIETWPVPSKVAVVAPDDLSFGLSRMHDVFREQEGVETRVFRTEQEAIGWLDSAHPEMANSIATLADIGVGRKI